MVYGPGSRVSRELGKGLLQQKVYEVRPGSRVSSGLGNRVQG